MAVMVTELRRMTGDFAVVPVLRYLLEPDGRVTAVPLEDGSATFIDRIARDGIPGAGGLLYPRDGAAFIAGLSRAYSGSRLWATPPFEMDLDAARTPPDPATLPPRRTPPPSPRRLNPPVSE